MVTYGPWQDGREYTETWSLGTIQDGTWAGNFGVTERTMTPYPTPADGSTPPTINQWSGFGGLRPGDLWERGTSQGDAALEGPPEVADPRFNTPEVSTDTWGRTQEYHEHAMLNRSTAALLNEGGVDPATIGYSSTFEPEIGTFSWIMHRENWSINHTEYTPRYAIRPNIDHAFMQIPPQPTPQHLFAEIEPPRATAARRSEAVSLKVDFLMGGSDFWHFFIKDIGVTSPGWKVGGEAIGDQSVNGMKSGSYDMGPSGTFEFDVSLINEWKILNGTSTSAYFVPAALMPHVGIAWAGPWPGDWRGLTNEYPAHPTMTFTYVFNTPRWRWILADPVIEPYRRSIPARGDGLSGGPTRNYPPVKAQQSGRRNVGGFW